MEENTIRTFPGLFVSPFMQNDSCVIRYLFSADLLVSRLTARCDFLDDLVPVVLKVCNGVLQLRCAAELLGSDTVL